MLCTPKHYVDVLIYLFLRARFPLAFFSTRVVRGSNAAFNKYGPHLLFRRSPLGRFATRWGYSLWVWAGQPALFGGARRAHWAGGGRGWSFGTLAGFWRVGLDLGARGASATRQSPRSLPADGRIDVATAPAPIGGSDLVRPPARFPLRGSACWTRGVIFGLAAVSFRIGRVFPAALSSKNRCTAATPYFAQEPFWTTTFSILS